MLHSFCQRILLTWPKQLVKNAWAKSEHLKHGPDMDPIWNSSGNNKEYHDQTHPERSSEEPSNSLRCDFLWRVNVAFLTRCRHDGGV